jgi:hypothetical protein
MRSQLLLGLSIAAAVSYNLKRSIPVRDCVRLHYNQTFAPVNAAAKGLVNRSER